MAHHPHFPAIDRYDSLTVNDHWMFYPQIANATQRHGSLDTLPRKVPMNVILDFLSENLDVSATANITVQEEGVTLNTNFTTINFIGEIVTATDEGSGVANITIAASSDTHMMNTDLTATDNRIHDTDGGNWELEDGGDSILKYTAPGLVQLGTTANNISVNNAGNEIQLSLNSIINMHWTTSRITAYQNLALDQANLIFQNSEDNLITFQPKTTGVTNTTYTLPTSGSTGYLYNNGSNEWSWNFPSLMSELRDVASDFYQSSLDFVTQTFTTWDGNEPTEVSSVTWFTNFTNSTYLMVYDPVNDEWRPMPALDVVQYTQSDIRVYTDDGVLTGNRIVDTDNNTFSIYDVTNPTTSSTSIRLHNHRFRSSGNDIQIGYHAASESTALDGGLRFFPRNTTNGGVEDAYLVRYSGQNGNFHLQNKGTGELWIQNANSGVNNKIILRSDGEVEFNMYGSGGFTGTPAHALAVDSAGIIIETNPNTSVFIACSDETTDLTTGTAKVTFRMRNFRINEVRASVTTAPTGSSLIVDINEGGVSMFSTKLSIDAGEKTSTTAATPAVFSDNVIADDAEITIDIDQIGSTVAGTGLVVELIGYYL